MFSFLLLIYIMLPCANADTLSMHGVGSYSGDFYNEIELDGSNLDVGYRVENNKYILDGEYKAKSNEWFGYVTGTKDTINDTSYTKIGAGYGKKVVDQGFFYMKPSISFFFYNNETTEVKTDLSVETCINYQKLIVKHDLSYLPELKELYQELHASYKLSEAFSLSYETDYVNKDGECVNSHKTGLVIDLGQF